MNSNFWTLSMLGLAALVAATTASDAQQNCAPRDLVIERLASAYGETRQSIGLAQNNLVFEVFASTQTGSWTITVTRTDGVTCLVASGQAFDTVTGQPALKDDV